MNDVHEIRHGYNLADIDQIVRKALWRGWMTAIPFADRYDIAWSAVVEHLYVAGVRPERTALARAAEAAISKTRYDDWRHQGFDYNRGEGEMGRFVAYWTGLGTSCDFSGGIIDRTALWQIWYELIPRHRQALLALATHEDYQAAADALGLSYAGYKMLLTRARRAFYALWHEGETPSRPWGTDRRQGSKRRSVTSLIAKRAKAVA